MSDMQNQMKDAKDVLPVHSSPAGNENVSVFAVYVSNERPLETPP